MTYILQKDRPQNSPSEWEEAWTVYIDYLESIKEELPESVFEFARAPWHYDFQDHRSPHDAWLESLLIREDSTGDRRQNRSLKLKICLLGAYHNGNIAITYQSVKRYHLLCPSELNGGHADWLYDEIRLSEHGNCLHEIEWSSGANWLIEFGSLEYKWMPLVSNAGN